MMSRLRVTVLQWILRFQVWRWKRNMVKLHIWEISPKLVTSMAKLLDSAIFEYDDLFVKNKIYLATHHADLKSLLTHLSTFAYSISNNQPIPMGAWQPTAEVRTSSLTEFIYGSHGKRYFMSTVITELMLNLEKVDEGFSRDNGARGTYYHRQFSELSVSLFSFMEALLAGALS